MPPQSTVTTTTTQEKKAPKLPSLEEIRNAIPKECFEKSALKSIYYLVQDYVIIAGLYWILPFVEEKGGWLGLFAWYWACGIFMSSLFVVGHDAGHGSFSEYIWLNNICGHLAHVPILAPYWPWQKTHRQHHQYTSHIDKDKGHPWVTEEDHNNRDIISKNFSKFPLSGFFRWNPVYTVLGLPDGSHFWPYSRIFTNTTERIQCVISGGLCFYFAWYVLEYFDYSVYKFIKYYYVPLLFQGFWLVMITYLQHQEEEIEVYEEGTWNFVRGQSQTIDRYYGLGLDSMLHHITDGHVAHHFFFTRIPHYNLIKATEAIQKVFERYPGVYKRRSNYDHVLEFLRLNFKLDYLLGRGTGVMQYTASERFRTKQN